MDEISHIAAVGKLFEETRRRLVETGTRNRLVHVNRQNGRSNSLEIINKRSNDIFRLLVSSSRTMHFQATGRDNGSDSDTPSLLLDGAAADSESRRELGYRCVSQTQAIEDRAPSGVGDCVEDIGVRRGTRHWVKK